MPVLPRSAHRDAVLSAVATAVLALSDDGVRRIAVDGVDGAGKTVFADELAAELERHGKAVIRASVDGFHHPREVRYRRGRTSPEGYYRDSYDYETLRRLLLDPLSPGGNGVFRRAIHDVDTEAPVDAREERAGPSSALVLDGIFLHRPELAGYWDLSVFVAVDHRVAVSRCADRDGTSPDIDDPANHRYVEGQRRYLRECRPAERATLVVDNTDVAHPRVVAR